MLGLALQHLVLNSCVWFFLTLWTVVCQASLSMEFSRQEYWVGLPLPTLEDLLDPRIKAMLPALAGGFLTTELIGKPKRMELCTLHWPEIKPWSPAWEVRILPLNNQCFAILLYLSYCLHVSVPIFVHIYTFIMP